MKIIIILALLLLFGEAAYSQSSLDGRKFAIVLYRDKERDSSDTLFFDSGMLNYATAKKFGFQPAEYKAKEKNKNIIVTALNKSKINGTMLWNLTVMQDSTAGTAVFDTNLQNPVKYSFTGKEIKE